MEPKIIDRNVTLLFEGIGPFSAVLILRVFPLRANTFLEKVIIRFKSKFRGGCDVVLCSQGSISLEERGMVNEELT